MSQAFGKNNGRPNRVKRNAIDGSFQSNGSYNYGYLYPVLCKEALPGDSFEIDITAALRAMPFVFPVQTRQRVEFNAFYVRNRNLWDDWPDFISKTKEGLVSPFLSGANLDDIRTCSLFDYLGLPTTISGDTFFNSGGYNISSFDRISSFFTFDSDDPYSSLLGQSLPLQSVNINVAPNVPGYLLISNEMSSTFDNDFLLPSNVISDVNLDEFAALISSEPISSALVSQFDYACAAYVFYDSSSNNRIFGVLPVDILKNDTSTSCQVSVSESSFLRDDVTPASVRVRFCVWFYKNGGFGLSDSAWSPSNLKTSPTPASVRFVIHSEHLKQPVDFLSNSSFVNPFGSSRQPVSSLPCRAYEQIYNAFYRDDRNNPLIIDGHVEYNKYLVNTSGGEDNFHYKLHRRNWEQDCFTTALPSPQQGVAPLVGISSTGAMTFSDPDSGQSYTVQAKLADDADTIVGAQFTENVPNSVARSIVNYATSGISINDFRNVNAFQRWLETNIRRGMKYRDQIKSHYDVDVRYDELDMPEFIGGTTIDINMNTISQTSESSTNGDGWSSALGSYAGNGFAVGRGKHTIKHYCDEHGFIMVIMSIIPVPNYSQTMEKFWFKTDALDYFFPEFGHIGLQAIPNKLLSPVQSAQVSLAEMNHTFGYQRPWFEYLENRDEVHGLLRTQLRNFVLNRYFEGIPSLNEDFLLIDPKQMDEAFAVTDITDKWVGQIFFDIKMKRPIPLYGVPRLESDI